MTCSTCRDRIQELEEEVRQLKGMLAPSIIFPEEWGLRTSEARVLAAFYARPNGFLTNQSMISIVVKLKDAGCANYPKVLISKFRQKLGPFGITFETRKGSGYRLTAVSRDLIRKALAASEIVEAVKERFMPGSMT